jgi:D-3-phosphoglycerate dehydrogenase / 2-oxoglutarate reductase
MTARVLMTDNIFGSLDEFHAELRPLDLELEVAQSSDEATLARLAGSAAGIIVVYAKVTEPVIVAAAAAGCRVISRCGIGFDNIDVDAATRYGIQVTYVPDYCLDEVADHAIMLLLASARALGPALTLTRQGGWGRPTATIHRLTGRRLALIGIGRIGRRVASRAAALGLSITAFDPFVTEWKEDGISRAGSLEDAVADADFVSLHAPLTPQNHHLVNARTLAAMKRKPVLINTARGGLVDLDAVAAALSAGQLSGVALDVFETEPLPSNHSLRTNPRALITPHLAYYSIESESELKRRAAEEVTRAIRGEPPRCPVNKLEAQRAG